MAGRQYYDAYSWWKEDLKDEFQILLNPLLDKLDRRITIGQLKQYFEDSFSTGLPYISSVYTDGVSITGTGSVTDPLVATAGSNIYISDGILTTNRTLNGDGLNLNFENVKVKIKDTSILSFVDVNDISTNIIIPTYISSTDIEYTLPVDQGNGTTLLQNDGSGNLSWVTISNFSDTNWLNSNLTASINVQHNLDGNTFELNNGASNLLYFDPLQSSFGLGDAKLSFLSTEKGILDFSIDFCFKENVPGEQIETIINHKGVQIYNGTNGLNTGRGLFLHSFDNSAHILLRAPDNFISNIDFYLPTSFADTQILKVNGSGQLEFIDLFATSPIIYDADNFTFDFDQTVALDNVARTTVRKNSGTDTGSRRRLNFIEGSNVSITVADDSINEEVDITISSVGGGNNFAPTGAQYLTLDLDGTLTNERVFLPGENLSATNGGPNSNYTLSVDIGSLEVNVITDTPSTNQNNYNPTGWDSTYPNKSTIIRIEASESIIITGLEGGRAGRVAILQNCSDNLIILEHEGPTSSATNRFHFVYKGAFFLMPRQSINFVYDATYQQWVPMSRIDLDDMFTTFDDFYGGPPSALTTANVAGMWTAQISGTSSGVQDGSGSEANSGVIDFISGTAAGAILSLGSSSGSGSNLLNSNCTFLFLTRLGFVNIPTIAQDFKLAIGLHNRPISAYALTGINGCYWRYDRAVNATNWSYVTQNQFGSQTVVDSGIPVTTGQRIYGVYVPKNTYALFITSTSFANGYTITKQTTNMPSNTTPVGPYITHWRFAGTSSISTYRVDFLGVNVITEGR